MLKSVLLDISGTVENIALAIKKLIYWTFYLKLKILIS